MTVWAVASPVTYPAVYFLVIASLVIAALFTVPHPTRQMPELFASSSSQLAYATIEPSPSDNSPPDNPPPATAALPVPVTALAFSSVTVYDFVYESSVVNPFVQVPEAVTCLVVASNDIDGSGMLTVACAAP